MSNFENNLDCAIDFYFVFNWKVIYCMKKNCVLFFFFFVGSLEWKLNVCWCFDCYQFTTILSCLYKPDLKHTVHKTLKLKMLLFKNQFLGIFIAFNIMLFVWMLKWEFKPKLLKPEFMIDTLYFEYCCGHFSILFWLL